MSTSRLPACVDALVEAIRLVVDDLPNDQVIDGWPSLGDLPNEVVVVGGTRDAEERWALLGARGRNEEFEIEVVIRAAVSGDSQKKARDRAYGWLDAIAAWLRTNPTLGVAGVYDAQLYGTDYTPFPTDEGLAVQLEAGVRIRTRI